jgi:hypothetical protein
MAVLNCLKDELEFLYTLFVSSSSTLSSSSSSLLSYLQKVKLANKNEYKS